MLFAFDASYKKTSATIVSGPPLEILIHASDPRRAALLEEALRDSGAIVHRARDSADLPARIAALGPDAVLIDAGKGSAGTLARMLDVARVANRPIAMFVDAADGATVEAAVEAGVSAFIVDGLRKARIKPIVDLAISRFHSIDRLKTELLEAKLALEDRKLIERAKALLMKQGNLSEEEAYGLLRRGAMNQNRKMADLAKSLLAAAELLDAGRRD